jgi:hypothetical protein
VHAESILAVKAEQDTAVLAGAMHMLMPAQGQIMVVGVLIQWESDVISKAPWQLGSVSHLTLSASVADMKSR